MSREHREYSVIDVVGVCFRSMANGCTWTLNSALDRLKAELDSTVQFWLKHSHDKECGCV